MIGKNKPSGIDVPDGFSVSSLKSVERSFASARICASAFAVFFSVFSRRMGIKALKGLGKVALTVEAAGGGNGGNALSRLRQEQVGALHDSVF